jgi:hypothetical protein
VPQSITIAAFVFGAVLILLSLIVGKFELFGAKVDGTVGKTGRVIAFILGIFLIGKGLNLDTSTGQTQQPSNPPPARSVDKPSVRTEQAASPAPIPTHTSRDFGNFMQGVWYARVPAVSGGAIEATIQYFADHSFRGSQSALVAGYRSTQPVLGTWNIRTLSPDEFILTANYLGGVPISSTFRVLDDNSIENEGQNYIAHRTSR